MFKKRRDIAAVPVSAVGLGCWSITGMQGGPQAYGSSDPAQSRATLRHALDIGVNLIDTAQVYGPFDNEELVGECIAGRRDDAYVATKFGFQFEGRKTVALDSSPKTIRANCEGSLR